MGLFSFDKKSKDAEVKKPEESKSANTTATVVKPAASIRPSTTSNLGSAESQNDLYLKMKLQRLEKQYKLQTAELQEHEEYMRVVMQQLTDAFRQKKLADAELNEHEDYLRSLMESYQKLNKSYKWQTNEIAEHEEYTRKLLEGVANLQKQSKFKDQEIEEHEEYTRKLLESFSELNKQSKFKDQEIAEHEDYTRKILESYNLLGKQSKLKDKEIAEQEDYLRSVMANYQKAAESLKETQRKLHFAEGEIKEQELYTRQVAEELNKLKSNISKAEQRAINAEKEVQSLFDEVEKEKRKSSFRETEIKEQEEYLRSVLDAYTQALKKTRDINAEVLDHDNSTREFLSRLAPSIKSAGFVEKEILEQEKYIRNLVDNYNKASKKEQLLAKHITGFKGLINSALATQILDKNGFIVSVNEKWTQLNGFSHKDVIGMADKAFCQFDTFELNRYQIVWEGLKLGKLQTIELTKIKNSGKPIKVSANYIPILDTQNNLLEIIKVETPLAEVKTETSTLDALFSVTNNWLVFVELNENLQILNASDSFVNLVGGTKNQLVNKPIDEFFTRNFELQNPINDLILALKRGRTIEKQIEILGENRQVKLLDAKFKPLLNSHNEFVSCVMAAQFINNETQYGFNKNFGLNHFVEPYVQNNYQDTNDLALITLDESLLIKNISNTVAQNLGYLSFELNGKPFTYILSADESFKGSFQNLFNEASVKGFSKGIISFVDKRKMVQYYTVNIKFLYGIGFSLQLIDATQYVNSMLSEIKEIRKQKGSLTPVNVADIDLNNLQQILKREKVFNQSQTGNF